MERTNGAARVAQALSPAQRRAMLAIADLRQGSFQAARVRRDVLNKLRALHLIDDRAIVTDAGRLVADELRVAQRRGAQNGMERTVDVVEALTTVEHRSAPVGVPGAVARLLFDLPGDAERVHALAWLAGPEGAGYLGAIKDAFIVAARRGRTYDQAAAHLRITNRAVNRAVARFNVVGRQSEVDKSNRAGG